MKAFISRPVPESWLSIIKGKIEYFIFPEDRPLKKEELISFLSQVEGAIVMLADRIDRDVIDNAKKLKIISNYAVGYDNIDISYATKKGIIVTNTPDVLTNATAEHALSLLFAISRRIVEGDRLIRRGKFEGWSPTLLLGLELKVKKVGVIGAGRIGMEFARKVMALGMEVIYFSRRKKRNLEEMGAKYRTLDDLLKEADIISIHLPLTSETYHLIGEREIKLMRKDAIVINTGRGAVIDEIALAHALKEKRIRGAGLDVFEFEPGITKILLELDNVVLTPHIGSATERTRKKMMEIACKNLLLALEGKQPEFIVNPEVIKD